MSRSSRLALGLVLCAAPVARAADLAPAAPAKGPPTLAIALVGTDPGTSDQAQKVEEALLAALERDGRIQPAKPPEPAAEPAAPDDGEVDAHLKAAKAAYDSLDLDTAAKEYGAAIRAEFAHPERANVARAAQTFLEMGAAFQLNGDAAHAQGAYRFALALAPTLQPDPQLFGPDIRQAFEAQRQALQSAVEAAPTTLDVDLDGPASGQVTIDGRDAGPAPVRGFKVLPGRHLVVARAEGFATAAKLVEVGAGDAAQARLALDETPAHKLLSAARARALAERAQREPGEGVAELAQRTGAQLVAVGTLSSNTQGSTHLDLTLFDVRTHARVAGIARDLEVDTSRFAAQADALAGEIARDVAAPVAEPPAVAGRRPVYKRWYFWACVGAAVVAGSVAAVALSGSPGHLSHGAGVALGL